MPSCRGYRGLKRLVARAQDNPWSELEAEAHQRLRRAGVTGWVANHRVRIGHQSFYLDIAMPDHFLGIELDGHAHHSTRQALSRDVARQNALVMAGWTILRFTWDTLDTLVPNVNLLMQRTAR